MDKQSKLLEMLAKLRKDNPTIAMRFYIPKYGGSILLADSEGKKDWIIVTTRIDCDQLVNAGMEDGTFLTVSYVDTAAANTARSQAIA